MKGIFEKKNSFDIIAFDALGFRGFPPMFHPHCELIYVKKGFVDVTIDGASARINEGGISFLFPYITHSYENAPDAIVSVMLFDSRLTAYEKLLLNNKPKNPFLQGNDSLARMFSRVIEMNHSKDKEIAKGAVAYLNAIIAELLPFLSLEKSNSVELDISKKILEYCSEHFCEKISIKRLSDELFISQSYVSKVFSNKLCYAFREYINALRIDKAKKMLKTTELKIVDIMLECGFENQSSFNRVFMDIVGESPGEYRKNKS